jgi:hypothetical protein
VYRAFLWQCALHVVTRCACPQTSELLGSSFCSADRPRIPWLNVSLTCPGRSLSLLDPTYASKYIPIIASVSEHQPPAWPSYFTDLNIMVC